MTRLKDILSRDMAVLLPRPAGGLKRQVRRAFGAVRSSVLRPMRAAGHTWRLLSALSSRGLGWLRQRAASRRALAALAQRRAAHLRALPTRLRFLSVAPRRLRTWAVDARGYWVMHQEAGGKEQGGEPTQEGDAISIVGQESPTQVNAAEKELREIRRRFSKQVKAAARRLARTQEQKARRLYRGKGIILYEDRIETRQGVAHFTASPVQATVHFGSSAEEPQVIVDALDFVSVLPSKPGMAGRLANKINQAAWLGPEIAAKRAQAISTARLNLEKLETERDERIRAAESRVEAAHRSL